MKKRKSLKTALSLALVFFGIKFVLDTLLLLCPPFYKATCSFFISRVYLEDISLSTIAKVISIIVLILALLPKAVLTLYNLGKNDLIKQRGLTTIIFTAVFSLLSSVISVFSNVIIHKITNVKEVSLLSALSSVRSVTSLFSGAATIIIYCCAAIEIYNGIEKPPYPPYNGINAEQQNSSNQYTGGIPQ